MSHDLVNAKSEIPDKALPTAPSSWLKRILRIARCSLLTLLALITLFTAIMWVRSYYVTDQVYGGVYGERWCFSGSNHGQIVFLTYRNQQGRPEELEWKIRVGFKRKPWALYGWEDKWMIDRLKLGYLTDVSLSSFDPFDQLITEQKADDHFHYNFDHKSILDDFAWWLLCAVCVHCSGVIVPHWILLITSGSLFTFIFVGSKFSLKVLLLWITCVCVTMGIGVGLQEPPATSNQSKIVHF